MPWIVLPPLELSAAVNQAEAVGIRAAECLRWVVAWKAAEWVAADQVVVVEEWAVAGVECREVVAVIVADQATEVGYLKRCRLNKNFRWLRISQFDNLFFLEALHVLLMFCTFVSTFGY